MAWRSWVRGDDGAAAFATAVAWPNQPKATSPAQQIYEIIPVCLNCSVVHGNRRFPGMVF